VKELKTHQFSKDVKENNKKKIKNKIFSIVK
jgi:hypothetical protein